MAIYERYRVHAKTWADRISGDATKLDYWKTIFDDHPEFFRKSLTYEDNYSLIWRRASPRRYDRRSRTIISDEAFQNLPDGEKKHITRPPVPEAQIKTLIDIAVGLHGRELETSRDWRWWVAPALSFAGSFFGALLAFAAAAMFKGQH